MLVPQHLLRCCAITWLASAVSGAVIPGRRDAQVNPGPQNYHGIHIPIAVTESFADGIPLRIMPLGASITHGYQSTDGNGYREAFRDQVIADGNLVNMVGNNPNGTMVDNDNEGWPGFVITQVIDKAKISVPAYLPNLILINLGTNDCVQNIDIPNAGSRMNDMITYLWSASPKATIILSTLLVNGDAAANARVTDVNSQYTALADSLQSAGKPIVLADMQGPLGPTTAELVDGTHPNDTGYKQMATIFYNALTAADAKGFLQTADPVDGIPDSGA